MTTNSVASRKVMAPRGSSRAAVRGLSASKRASTRRLNPIAAERAATIATRIQKILAIGDTLSAPASAC
jgi:hypothetical protein